MTDWTENRAVAEYIRLHREEDVRTLALRKDDFPPDVRHFALQQIEGWQIARHKIPLWAATDGICFPVKLSLEQCSSEMTARYKASQIGSGESFADLTGGMGVDFSFVAKNFNRSVYVERNEQLCELSRHNFPILGVTDFSVSNTSLENFVEENADAHFSSIYLDPARRDGAGRKLVSIADCSPNLLEWQQRLLDMSDSLWVKYSPMLDITKALSELDCVAELHIVALENECKELLFRLNRRVDGEVCVHCVNLRKDDGLSDFSFVWGDEKHAPLMLTTELGRFLYEPNAAVMKSGAFKILSEKYAVGKLAVSSHLYTSDSWVEDFPGRRFEVEASFPMNKESLRKYLPKDGKVNLAVRNFPLTVEQLRAKLKLSDGGDVYLFATTFQEKKILIKCRQLRSEKS